MEIVRDEDGKKIVFISMRQPDDPHTHLRDGEILSETVNRSGEVFGRVLAMPNTTPPLTSIAECHKYLKRVHIIQKNLVRGSNLKVYTALYLTGDTSAMDIEQVAEDDNVVAVKLYPAGVTTGSASGVSDVGALDHVFYAMEERGVILSMHGEMAGVDFDVFERERIFVNTILPVIVKRHPNLKIILEHVSTQDGAEFIASAGENVAATIAPQHITYTRTDMLAKGMRSDLFCFPVLQTEYDRQAVLNLATSGNPRVFLGTDSAPHPIEKKNSGCAPGGFYARHPLSLYIKAFDSVGAIEKLENFASVYAAEFYGWELNSRSVAIQKNAEGKFFVRSDLF